MGGVFESSPSSRRSGLLRLAAGCTALLALVGYLVLHLVTSGSTPPRCTVRGPGQNGTPFTLQPEQAVNAATIEAVGSSRGLPERAITIALAAAMQESGLRNIDYGDRDSLGLFQQRPSQGWGTGAQIRDPVYAAGKFYDHLVTVPGYSRLPLTVAAQRVQKSGFPQAYAKHEPHASLLAAALTGRSSAAFSCTSHVGSSTAGDVTRVQKKLMREFGRDVLPVPRAAVRESGSSGSPRAAAGSGAAGGATLEVPVRAVRTDGGDARRGWELAHWAVAHATELHIAQVSYGGRVWSSSNSDGAWRPSGAESGAGVRGEVRITIVQ
ncbi:hypothetical protein [Streptomyces meridianus]|uniref:ARB-07466-like C-terminal domain-containing protein n=1 Tax=Streptomyces meridianus TaxID=2938945 RepID=A0ABT0X0X0_9ACTN|nr:hypothetical protein [Streptomyces meridianus]MCM2576206.1 hypothetical protein [Streptomyces meridianus]